MNEWLYKADQFFNIDHTLEASKVKLASIHLEDKALHWFKSYIGIREKGKALQRSKFVEALVARFGDQLFEDPIAELKKLQQVSSLQTYLEEFDLKLCETNLSEAQAISYFLGGLREEVEIAVRVLKPTSLKEAYALAKVQDVLWSKNNYMEKMDRNNGFDEGLQQKVMARTL